jgi:hypothetical protein
MNLLSVPLDLIKVIKREGKCIRNDSLLVAYELKNIQVWEQDGKIGIVAFNKLNILPHGDKLLFRAGNKKHLIKAFKVLFPNKEIPR